MSNALIKAGYVNYGKTGSDGKKKVRVIDSNDAVSDKIKVLSEKLEQVVSEEDFADEFTEGLDAEMVDALLTDQEESTANKEAYEKIINDANEEAAQILLDAQNKAAEVRDGAVSEVAALKEEARTQGHNEGYDAGYEEAMTEVNEQKRKLEEEKEALEAQYEEMINQLEPQFVDTLTDIYSHVFGTDIKDRNGVVLHLLNNAIRNIEGSRNFLVHVSKDDRQEVEEHKDGLSEGLGSGCSIEIVEDVTLSKGACFVETDSGIFDCSIDTELELLKKELRILAYSKDN